MSYKSSILKILNVQTKFYRMTTIHVTKQVHRLLLKVKSRNDLCILIGDEEFVGLLSFEKNSRKMNLLLN